MEKNKNGPVGKVSAEKREKIRRKTAFALPDNPTAQGMKPQDIKKAFYAAITDGEISLLEELDRVAEEANEAFSEAESQRTSDDERIGRLEDDVNAHSNRLSTLESDVKTNSDDISRLDKDMVKKTHIPFVVYGNGTYYPNEGRKEYWMLDPLYSHDGVSKPSLYFEDYIPVRGGGGSIYGPSPNHPEAYANKEYVDQEIQTVNKEIDLLKYAAKDVLYTFEHDDRILYQKVVPQNAMPYALVEGVPRDVGEIYPVSIKVQGKNLLDKLITEQNRAAASRTAAGVSISINEDGSITLDGKAAANINIGLAGGGVHAAGEETAYRPNKETYLLGSGTFTISLRDINKEVVPYGGKIYLIVGNNPTNESKVPEKWYYGRVKFSVSMTGNMGCCLIQIPKGATFNNETFFPQLESGNTVTNFATPWTKTYQYNAKEVEVEGGGVITFENRRALSITSKVTYQIKTGGITE